MDRGCWTEGLLLLSTQTLSSENNCLHILVNFLFQTWIVSTGWEEVIQLKSNKRSLLKSHLLKLPNQLKTFKLDWFYMFAKTLDLMNKVLFDFLLLWISFQYKQTKDENLKINMRSCWSLEKLNAKLKISRRKFTW